MGLICKYSYLILFVCLFVYLIGCFWVAYLLWT